MEIFSFPALSSSILCASAPLREFFFSAVPSFPRGPGFYYSPVKLVAVLAVYLCWVKTCWWVDQDAKDLHLPRKTWNPVLLGAGLFGLLVVWALPVFGFSFLVLVLLYLTATLSYVYVRNE